MKINYTRQAAEDITYWKTHDRKIYRRIRLLLEDITAHPFDGIGKPEALRYNLTGKWSRRITREHRLVYAVEHGTIIIYQCRFHYQ